MRFANTMPGVAVVGDAGGIVGEFRNAACVADDGYARDGASGSV